MEHNLDPQQIAASFSKAAPDYNKWAEPHLRIAQNLLSFLPERADTILELGCGTGILTKLLCSKYPLAKITAIDIAPGMVEQCKERCQHKNLSVTVAAAEEFRLPNNADLIVSSSSFHWFYDKAAVAKNIQKSLAPHGRFAVAMSVKGFFQELYTLYKSITGEPLALLWDDADCRNVFSDLNLPMERAFTDSFQMEAADPWHALRSINKIGAAPRGLSHPLSLGELKQLALTYANQYKTKNGVKVTYNIFYGITGAL